MGDIGKVEKKYREAQFFLGKLWERARIAGGDPDELDFWLSAFLSAGRSVDYWLRHEFPASYPHFFRTWEAALPTDCKDLPAFIHDDRADEVHEGGSQRIESHVSIPFSRTYKDAGGTVTIVAPIGAGPPYIFRPRREYVINGMKEDVRLVCKRYLDLLRKLIDDFNATGPKS